MEHHDEIILECRDITKIFFGNVVLDKVNMKCKKGTVLALVGENGAGKSTLTNIISANLKPNSGTIFYFNKETNFKTPLEARSNGIVVVHQLLSLIPELSVGENILLGMEPQTKTGRIDNKKLHEEAKSILETINFKIDVFKTVSNLTPAEKQMVEISKAWAAKPKLLILDEPTSSLSTTEVEQLFEIINNLKRLGVSIILITHRLDEIFQVCDEAVVLKDGQLVLTALTNDITKDDLICAMVGREANHAFPERGQEGFDSLILEIQDIGLSNRLQNINLKVHKGRIVGIAGLEGHGQRYLARGLFGIERFSTGSIIFEGKKVDIDSPQKAKSLGIAFIPDDRDQEGLIKPLSVSQNIVIATLRAVSKAGIIIRKKFRESAGDAAKILSIKAPSLEDEVGYLSGGNQQKVVFSKCIKTNPKLFILHEPTRGIDVQTKVEIYHLLRRLTKEGVSILLFSSDMLEIIGLCDEIHVIYEGSFTGSIAGEDATEEKIMKLSSGQHLDKAENA